MAQPPAPTLAQLLNSLTTASVSKLPSPHPSFITPILASSKSLHLPSLTATVRHRITASDISLPHILDRSTTASLPFTISDKTVVSSVLSEDVFVQVLEIEDLSRSKWEQVESLESVRKGEMTKGREVIRVIPAENEDANLNSQAPTQNQNQAQSSVSKGPHKLLLQDVLGNTVWAFELRRIEKIGYPPVMGIGCKMWLKKGSQVARGMVLLQPEKVQVVGGRIETLDKVWKEGREERLRERVKNEATLVAAGEG